LTSLPLSVPILFFLYFCNYLGSAEATRLANTWISAIISNPEKDLQVKLAISVETNADPDPGSQTSGIRILVRLLRRKRMNFT
jgi:hypothetical protein